MHLLFVWGFLAYATKNGADYQMLHFLAYFYTNCFDKNRLKLT